MAAGAQVIVRAIKNFLVCVLCVDSVCVFTCVPLGWITVHVIVLDLTRTENQKVALYAYKRSSEVVHVREFGMSMRLVR